MRDYIEKACEEIDAAMFTGDAFENAAERIALRKYLARWNRELTRREVDDYMLRISDPDPKP